MEVAPSRDRAAALLVLTDSLFLGKQGQIVSSVARSRLPAMYSQREFVDDGGLVSYRPSLSDMFRRAATHVDKILRGARPGDLPVEQPVAPPNITLQRTGGSRCSPSGR